MLVAFGILGCPREIQDRGEAQSQDREEVGLLTFGDALPLAGQMVVADAAGQGLFVVEQEGGCDLAGL